MCGGGEGWFSCSAVSGTYKPMACSPPGFSVHGILQARTLECVATSFSRGSFQPRDRTHVSCIADRFFTTELLGILWMYLVAYFKIIKIVGAQFLTLAYCVPPLPGKVIKPLFLFPPLKKKNICSSYILWTLYPELSGRDPGSVMINNTQYAPFEEFVLSIQ